MLVNSRLKLPVNGLGFGLWVKHDKLFAFLNGLCSHVRLGWFCHICKVRNKDGGFWANHSWSRRDGDAGHRIDLIDACPARCGDLRGLLDSLEDVVHLRAGKVGERFGFGNGATNDGLNDSAPFLGV